MALNALLLLMKFKRNVVSNCESLLEHLSDPAIYFTNKKTIEDDGILIIEVPHARDILIETFDIRDFKTSLFGVNT